MVFFIWRSTFLGPNGTRFSLVAYSGPKKVSLSLPSPSNGLHNGYGIAGRERRRAFLPRCRRYHVPGPGDAALSEPLFARRCWGRNRDNFMPNFWYVIVPQNSLQVFFREKWILQQYHNRRTVFVMYRYDPSLIISGSSILHVRYSDDVNVAFFADSGGSVFELQLKRGLRGAGGSARCIFSGARGEVCTMEPLRVGLGSASGRAESKLWHSYFRIAWDMVYRTVP